MPHIGRAHKVHGNRNGIQPAMQNACRDRHLFEAVVNPEIVQSPCLQPDAVDCIRIEFGSFAGKENFALRQYINLKIVGKLQRAVALLVVQLCIPRL